MGRWCRGGTGGVGSVGGQVGVGWCSSRLIH